MTIEEGSIGCASLNENGARPSSPMGLVWGTTNPAIQEIQTDAPSARVRMTGLKHLGCHWGFACNFFIRFGYSGRGQGRQRSVSRETFPDSGLLCRAVLSAELKNVGIVLQLSVFKGLQIVANWRKKGAPLGRSIGNGNSKAPADIAGHGTDEDARWSEGESAHVSIEAFGIIVLFEQIAFHVR